MAYLSEQVAYLRGLADGMKIDDSTNEGKLLLKIVDVLENGTNEVHVTEELRRESMKPLERMLELSK